MKSRLKIIIPLLVVAIAAGAVWYHVQKRAGDKPGVIRLSGNIEVTDAQVSFKIGGRVEKRLVDEGQIVQTGQLVAVLDSREQEQDVAMRRAEVEAAKAALAELEAGSRPEEIAQARAATARAQAALDELLAGSRPEEIRTAEATLKRSEAEAAFQKRELDRVSELYRNKFATLQELDTVRSAYEVAAARVQEARQQLRLAQIGPRKEAIDQARAALQQLKQQQELVEKGPRKETIDQARARLSQAQQNLKLSETLLSYTTISSPLTGVVLSKNIEPGEYVAPGTPIVTVGDLVNVWLRAYINEEDLGRVKVGQAAKIRTDTYPGKVYEGNVSFISSQAEFTPKNVQTQKERVKLVYRIKIDIVNPKMELKPGMPADAEILLDSGGK